MTWKQLLMFSIPSFVLAIVLVIIYGLLRRWERMNPSCSRCGARGKQEGIEIIKLFGGTDTNYRICQRCKSQAKINPGEYEWACILAFLDFTVESCISKEGFNVAQLIFWPVRKSSEGIETPFSVGEIMVEVNRRDQV